MSLIFLLLFQLCCFSDAKCLFLAALLSAFEAKWDVWALGDWLRGLVVCMTTATAKHQI